MHTLLLVLHFVGLALGVGTSFAMATHGRTAAGLPPAERGPFMERVGALAKNGGVGLVLLLVSGVGLTMERGGMALLKTAGGAFHAKLTLVVVLIGIVGMIHATQAKLRREGPGPVAARLPKLGAAGLLTGLAIVVLAVMTFQ